MRAPKPNRGGQIAPGVNQEKHHIVHRTNHGLSRPVAELGAGKLPVDLGMIGGGELQDDHPGPLRAGNAGEEQRLFHVRRNFRAGKNPCVIAVGGQFDQSVTVDRHPYFRVQMKSDVDIGGQAGAQGLAGGCEQTVAADDDRACMGEGNLAVVDEAGGGGITVVAGGKGLRVVAVLAVDRNMAGAGQDRGSGKVGEFAARGEAAGRNVVDCCR